MTIGGLKEVRAHACAPLAPRARAPGAATCAPAPPSAERCRLAAAFCRS
jgi:hypothetical protein